MKEMRYAIRVFYLGRNYRGFQIQNDLDTVEKRLQEALREANYLKEGEPFSYSSRTDKGVDAFQQVISFDTDDRLILPKINTHLPPDIIMWASAAAPPDFSPRFHATSRSYRYICRKEDENIGLMREASQLFLGKHDLCNFCKYVDGDMTNRTVTAIDIKDDKGLLIFTMKAPAFLYQMVRRVVACLQLVGRRQMSLEDVSSQLEGHLIKENRIGPAPIGAQGSLILFEIEYPFKFKVDPYSFEKLNRFLNQNLSYHLFNEKVISEYQSLYESIPSSGSE